jgi:hypothetical protein
MIPLRSLCALQQRQRPFQGLPPLRSQGSPLRSDPFLRYRCGVDKPLTSFIPLL